MPRSDGHTYADPLCQYRRPRTPAQLAAYFANQKPNPEHTRRLRAGIAEFRRMLDTRYPAPVAHEKDGAPLITTRRVVLSDVGTTPTRE
jgi:hypothetical protein